VLMRFGKGRLAWLEGAEVLQMFVDLRLVAIRAAAASALQERGQRGHSRRLRQGKFSRCGITIAVGLGVLLDVNQHLLGRLSSHVGDDLAPRDACAGCWSHTTDRFVHVDKDIRLVDDFPVDVSA
jgi:hypothetical protein